MNIVKIKYNEFSKDKELFSGTLVKENTICI